MERNNGPNEPKHTATALETIIVDPDSIIAMIKDEHRKRNPRQDHNILITPPFEGAVRGQLHATAAAHTYLPETGDEMIKLRPATFVSGHVNKRLPTPDRHPSIGGANEEFRREHDIGPERFLTDDEEEAWNEWWERKTNEWEQRVRDDLQNEIVLSEVTSDGGSVETTVTIRYESIDGPAQT